MPPQLGTRLAHYEIVSLLGKGGMGEVYRAKDKKLGRDVAIKVLPDELASNEERVARFEREAKVLASLNHPNIAAIYGFEEADGVKALVLELVEGPTLADRMAQGPIPVDEALPIARQIAEALEAGHEAGVVHRDLKPANIKLRHDGTVKVLDYGLAKALEVGPDISETLASVLKTEVNLDSLPAGTPAAIHTLLRRCLQRDLSQRLPHIGLARLEIDEIQRVPAGPEKASSPAAITGLGQRRATLLVGGGVLAGALLSGLAFVLMMRVGSRTPTQTVRFTVLPPEGSAFYEGPSGAVVAVAPEGGRLAFATGFGGGLGI